MIVHETAHTNTAAAAISLASRTVVRWYPAAFQSHRLDCCIHEFLTPIVAQSAVQTAAFSSRTICPKSKNRHISCCGQVYPKICVSPAMHSSIPRMAVESFGTPFKFHAHTLRTKTQCSKIFFLLLAHQQNNALVPLVGGAQCKTECTVQKSTVPVRGMSKIHGYRHGIIQNHIAQHHAMDFGHQLCASPL